MRIRVGVDMDGVVADLHPVWIDLINEELGTDYLEVDFINWDIGTLVGEHNAQLCRDLLNKEGLYRNLPVISNSREVLSELMELGCDIIIISRALFGGNPHIIVDKIEWLQEKLPEVSTDDAVFTSNKHLVDVDIMIDDSVAHLDKFDDEVLKILYEGSHNKLDKISDYNTVRASDQLDVLNIIREFIDEQEVR